MTTPVLTEKRGVPDAPETIGDELYRQRMNFANLLAALDPTDWEAPSRCSEWSVADVAGHVLNGAEFHVARLTGSANLARFTRYGAFQPAVTPQAWLRDSPRRTPDATINELRELAVSERELFRARLEAPDGEPERGPTGRPLHWSTRSLHSLWDSWIHERDVALALGQPAPSAARSFPLATMYGFLIVGSVAARRGTPLHVTLDLSDIAATPYEIGITADDVYVAAGSRTVPQVFGSAAEMLDSAAGRSPGLRTLQAPDFLLTALRHFRVALT
ncbi:maleylpyruvate isomerase family mycothiol-dependent enzyme [Actinoplanes sp. TRM 88003]|uniref:Maleylpyruvate isomerase family mycothiol-dependent enzyme n=1 Tax=Paractinoplanes aksuensis TaxID=2939490 RepID=A0ABT1DXQ5_9ACTN|nr:maleylpyruvate isomerase family mycothiol-dependent enzyme [Actinoplanes aksuensis]MCO8275550.1 maleylpyruvate isomerase family mycothiol-dependent enzyme [Actinoplanes aksuensis]